MNIAILSQGFLSRIEGPFTDRNDRFAYSSIYYNNIVKSHEKGTLSGGPSLHRTLWENPSSPREINNEALTINCILVTMLVLMMI